MAVKSSMIVSPQFADTARGPSPSIWGFQDFKAGAPVEDILQDPRLGYYLWDDFGESGGLLALNGAGQFGSWATYAETTDPTITDDGIVGAGWKLAASTTAHRGVALSKNAGQLRFTDTSGVLGGYMAFETRVRISHVAASTLDLFVGLMDSLPVASTVPVTNTGGSLSTTPNLFGFHARGGATNPGDFSVAYNVGGGTVQYPSGLTNLVNTVTGSAYVAATYVKLGFVFNPNPLPISRISTAATSGQTVGNTAAPTLRFFVNGQLCSTFLIKSDLTTGSANNALFPGAVMGPVIAFKQQSTTASVFAAVDWIRVAQLAVA